MAKFTAKPDPLRELADKLERWRRYAGFTAEDAANATLMSRQNYSLHIKQPNKITISEFWRLANAMKIPREEAVELLTSGLK